MLKVVSNHTERKNPNTESVVHAVLWAAAEELQKLAEKAGDGIITEFQSNLLDACKAALGANYAPSETMMMVLSIMSPSKASA